MWWNTKLGVYAIAMTVALVLLKLGVHVVIAGGVAALYILAFQIKAEKEEKDRKRDEEQLK